MSAFLGQRTSLGRAATPGEGGGGGPTPLIDFTAAAPFSSSDWMQVLYDNESQGPKQIMPAPGAVVNFTTPMISWPHTGTDSTSYRVEYRVKAGPGTTVVLTPKVAGRNYVWPDVELVRGTEYEYRVRHSDGATFSDWRPFTVSINAVSIVVPQGQALYNFVASRAHPRCAPKDFATRLVKFRTGGSMRAYTTQAKVRFALYEGDALEYELSNTTAPSVMAWIRAEYLRIWECWWIWQIELVGDSTFAARALAEGLRRLRGLIFPYPGSGTSGWYVDHPDAWSAYSGTGRSDQDQAGRAMIAAVSTGFDLFYSQLTTTDKQRCYAMAGYRLNQQMSSSSLGAYPLRANPEDSHGLNHSAVSGLAGMIFAGHTSEFSSYSFATTIPTWGRNADAALQDFNGFCGEDGDHWNLMGYSKFGWEWAGLIDFLGAAAGLDLWEMPRHGNQSKVQYAVFPAGNGSDWRRPWGDADLGYRNANFWTLGVPRADANWSKYAEMIGANVVESVVGTDDARGVWWLLRNAPAPASEAIPLNSGCYPDSGTWFSHSDAHDLGRMSILKRSSLNGAYNHRHIDHNGIVVSVNDVPLLIDSGYYGDYGSDGFGSTYWYGWYKRSIAHNTVACNGRVGQQKWGASDNVHRRVTGRLERAYNVEAAGANYAYCIADAKNAYRLAGYVHTKAKRATVHLRPNVALVFDHHIQASSYTWEWLFHTPTLPVLASGTVTVTNSGETLKLKSLYCNRALSSTTLNDTGWTTGTTPGLTPGGGAPAQWHNSFNYAAGTTFLACHSLVGGNAGDPSVLSASAVGNVITALVTLADGTAYTVVFDGDADTITVT